VNGSGGAGHLNTLGVAANAFGPATTSVPVTSSGTIRSVRFTAIENLAGTWSGLSGTPPGGGTMGLTGAAKICIIFPDCQFSQVTVPFTPTAGGAGLGIGGTVTIIGNLQLTLQHAPWTIGQPTMTIHEPGSSVSAAALPGGFAHGPASLSSSTAAGGGVVQLVTATKVYTSLAGSFPELPVFAVMALNFAPEPGTMLLIPAGVGALVLLGYRRSRK
jgi:hypothetical protein